jgi:hypothetical protein
MWARVARFEGDPGDIDDRVGKLRAAIDAGAMPPELSDAKFLLLVNRESGGMLGVTLFDSEEAMHKGDVAMNAGPGAAGSRAAVEFFEVPIQVL